VITAEVARRIRLLALDVDGVLTDNGIWIAPVNGQRVELKRFDIQDGLGLGLLRTTGIEVAWVSGRQSEATELRARELRIATVLQENKASKLPALERILEEKGLGWDELAYVGDDLPDLPILRRAGLAISVANGRPEARAIAHWVTSASGGHGAVREVVEGILQARGEWDQAVRSYLAERGETMPWPPTA
jgi:3-deoxy-D-manno-octulosonate 8-phosphate phosphatase (KDO 8-P phosphatase)